MQTVLVLATLSTGGIAVMQFVTESGGVKREATPAAITKELERAGRAGDGSWREGFPIASWRVVAPDQLPQDRRYRTAWRDEGDKLGLDLPKARELRLEALRAERGAALPELDVQWMKAQGQGRLKEASELEAKRQRLRDMPELIASSLEAAKSADELDAVGLPE